MKINRKPLSLKMSLSRDVRAQRKCKPVKCSRHFNQNGLISVGDRIYANSTTTDECNYSKCQGEKSNLMITHTNTYTHTNIDLAKIRL